MPDLSRPGRRIGHTFKTLCVLILFAMLSLPVLAEETAEEEEKPKRWHDKLSARLEFSDISYTTLNREVKVGARLEFSNLNREVYGVNVLLDYRFDEEIDSYTRERVLTEEFASRLRFSLTNLFHKHVDFASHYRFHYERETMDETRKDDVELSPVGVTLRAWSSPAFRTVAFSYLPQYNLHEYYYIDEDNNASTERKIERSLRHVGIFDLKIFLFKDHISLENIFTVKQTHAYDHIEGREEDNSDFIITNEAQARFHVNKIFSFGYRHEYENDERRARVHNQPRVSHNHCLIFAFSWNAGAY
jgi:hypothetical protein